jgi:outer membrane receptor protein involved in Fe transport
VRCPPRLDGRVDHNTATLSYGSLSDFQNNIPKQVVITFDLNPFNIKSSQYGGFIQDDYKLNPNLTLNLGLRYDYFSIPQEDDGRMYNRAADPANPQLGAGFGPYRPANSLYNADFNNFQPRVGFTYAAPQSSVLKDTVFRGGVGIFNSPHPIFGGPIDKVQDSASEPFRITLSSQSQISASGLNYPLPRSAYQTDLATLQSSGVISKQVVNTAIDGNFPNPYSEQWNLGVEHVLPFAQKISIDYIGNRGLKENMTETKNLPDRITGTPAVANFPTFRYYYAGDASNYHGLQIQLEKAPWKGLSYGSSYTWGRAMSFADANLLLQTPPQDPQNIKADYGRTPFDVRQRFKANVIFVPSIAQWLNKNSRASKLMLNGWQISGVAGAETGSPLAVQNGSSSYPADRPDVTPGTSPYLSNVRQTHQYLNKAAFTSVPISSLSKAQVRGGNLQRMSISGPGQITFDVTIGKTLEITETVKFQVKASAFNTFNHVNFSTVQANFASGSFGQVTAATPRTVQLTGRLTF